MKNDDIKIVYVLLDGVGDLPHPALNDLTPLEAALLDRREPPLPYSVVRVNDVCFVELRGDLDRERVVGCSQEPQLRLDLAQPFPGAGLLESGGPTVLLQLSGQVT